VHVLYIILVRPFNSFYTWVCRHESCPFVGKHLLLNNTVCTILPTRGCLSHLHQGANELNALTEIMYAFLYVKLGLLSPLTSTRCSLAPQTFHLPAESRENTSGTKLYQVWYPIVLCLRQKGFCFLYLFSQFDH